MMIMLNAWVPNDESLAKEWKENLVVMLWCFAPFISEELWEKLGHKESVFLAKWPEFDESKLVENTVTLWISINGKVRDQISLPADVSKDDAIKLAKETEGAKKWIEGKEIIKEIYVPGKLINIVVKG
jgi:leucyl-tRNA synthetase